MVAGFKEIRTVPIASGREIPGRVIGNSDFNQFAFYKEFGVRCPVTSVEVERLSGISGIFERRYVPSTIVSQYGTFEDPTASDLAFLSGMDALKNYGINPKDIPCLIVAHNFFDVKGNLGVGIDVVPSIASRIHRQMGIENEGVTSWDTVCSPRALSRLKEMGLLSGERKLVVGEYCGEKSLDPLAAYQEAGNLLLGRNPNTLESIIVTHIPESGPVECLAEKVGKRMGLEPGTLYFDVIGGCPGSVKSLWLADYLIRRGHIKRAMVIGAETLSKVLDKKDRDSPLFADASGSMVVEGREADSDNPVGIIASSSRTITGMRKGKSQNDYLRVGKSFDPDAEGKWMKMYGRGVFECAVGNGRTVIKELFDKSGVEPNLMKLLISHQANLDLNRSLLDWTRKLLGINLPDEAMPMILPWTGNSSVATPFLVYNEVTDRKRPIEPGLEDMRKSIESCTLSSGDYYAIFSVGAGMYLDGVLLRKD